MKKFDEELLEEIDTQDTLSILYEINKFISNKGSKSEHPSIYYSLISKIDDVDTERGRILIDYLNSKA